MTKSKRETKHSGLREYVTSTSSLRSLATAGQLPDRLSIEQISQLWTDSPELQNEVQEHLLTAVSVDALPENAIPQEISSDLATIKHLAGKPGLSAHVNSGACAQYFQEHPPAPNEEVGLHASFMEVDRGTLCEFLECIGEVAPSGSLLKHWGVPTANEEHHEPSVNSANADDGTKYNRSNVTLELSESGSLVIKVLGRGAYPVSIERTSGALSDCLSKLLRSNGHATSETLAATCKLKEKGFASRVHRLNKMFCECAGLPNDYLFFRKKSGFWVFMFEFQNSAATARPRAREVSFIDNLHGHTDA